MLRLAMLKTILRMKKKKRNNNRSSSCWPQESQTTGCNNWLITDLGTASRKEHKYYPFAGSAKGGPLNFFPPSGSNSTQQLDTVIFLWG